METLHTKKSKNKLQSNITYYSLLALAILITLIRINIPIQSKYNENTSQVEGILINNKLENNKATIIVKGQEKIQGTYYFKNQSEKIQYLKNIKLGNKIIIKGTIQEPSTPTTKNLFNYKQYLKGQKIYYIMKIKEIIKKDNSLNIKYQVKDKIQKRTTNPYIKSFLLGDTQDIKEEVKTSYQENGISHLFAISGMQFYLYASFLLKILKKVNIKEKTKYKIVFIVLLFYLSIIEYTASMIRSILFFFLFSINKVWKLSLERKQLIIISIIMTLLINPFYITEIAFWYSYVISIGLLLFMKAENNYFKTLVKSSIISFLLSIPISLYYFNQINILSILYNLFYIPYVNIILFPASMLTFVFPIIEPIYNLLIQILENTSLFLANISIGKLIFAKVLIVIYFIYLILLFLILKTKSNKLMIIYVLCFILHYILPTYFQKDFIKIIDVGQGDSILLYSKGYTALIDTGGKVSYNRNEKSTSITKYITIPLLKSLGIKKINTVFLTHADQDHMGEIVYLKDNFKINNIYLNLGEEKELEQELIKNEKNIKKANQDEMFSIGNYTLYQMNKEWNDENTSSSVYYVTHPNLSILLMGDATAETEEYLQQHYHLKTDVLKIGHHGSNTSSSLSFLKATSPKLAIISVGKNNRYNHPNEEVLTKLQQERIPFLATSSSGTITIIPETKEVIEDKKER